MRTASARRAAVQLAMTAASLSERRACRFTGFARSTERYQTTRDDRALQSELESLATQKPRWGYRRLHWLLVRAGMRINRKRVQ
ncbi:MAG: IS3 family transposase, partial [Gemmatimonadaceae bacterium]